MTGRREAAGAALLCAAGAGLVLLSGGQPWGRMSATSPDAAPGPGVTAMATAVTGRELTGATSALGWAALAGLAALVATRGWARVGVGALLAVFGGGIAAASAGAASEARLVAAVRAKSVLAQAAGASAVHPTSWWLVSVTGGVLVVAAGLWAAVRGRRWPGMSSRYDPGAAPVATTDPVDLWRSLDRGEDPTTNLTTDPTPRAAERAERGDQKER